MRQGIRKTFVNLLNPVYDLSLSQLADLYGTDKNYKHDYTKHYELFFSKIKSDKIKLLEIGIGGYDATNLGGASLRMWKKYFSKGHIYGLDIHDKSKINEDRIKTFKCDQTDKKRLSEIILEIGNPDIIIDDGSHKNNHVIETFNILFPMMNDGGIYVIEDVHTSYRDGYGGDSKNLYNKNTTMNYFKQITDNTNKKYFDRSLLGKNYETPTDIRFIYFSSSLIIIKKPNSIIAKSHK